MLSSVKLQSSGNGSWPEGFLSETMVVAGDAVKANDAVEIMEDLWADGFVAVEQFGLTGSEGQLLLGKYSNTGKYLVLSFSQHPFVYFYKVEGDIFTKINIPLVPNGNIIAVSFNTDDTLVVIGGAKAPFVHAMKISTTGTFSNYAISGSPTVSTVVYSSAISPDGNLIVLGSSSSTTDETASLTLYRNTGVALIAVSRQSFVPSRVEALNFSPNGKYLAAGSVFNYGHNITLYRVIGTNLYPETYPELTMESYCYGVEFTSDSKYLFTWGPNSTKALKVFKFIDSPQSVIELKDPSLSFNMMPEGVAILDDSYVFALCPLLKPYVTSAQFKEERLIPLLPMPANIDRYASSVTSISCSPNGERTMVTLRYPPYLKILKVSYGNYKAFKKNLADFNSPVGIALEDAQEGDSFKVGLINPINNLP